jgi:hypothetical protein
MWFQNRLVCSFNALCLQFATDIYDRLKIQKREDKSGMTFEAAWTPDGAVAVNRTRFRETLAQIQHECPERLKGFQDKNTADSDTLLSVLQQYAPKAVIFNDSFVN